MLTDPVEIEIISKAVQKNVRNPKRSRARFDNIFGHFLNELDLRDKVCLDMGPGQFDFGVLVRDRGGDVVAIDFDPAVLALGKHKGFRCFDADLRDLAQLDIPRPLDGIFCKFSISAFWFDAQEQQEFVQTLASLLASDGWLWIAPWNGTPDEVDNEDVSRVLSEQIAAYKTAGFDAWELSDAAARHYGVRGGVLNHVLFTQGVHIPDDAGLLRPISSESPFGSGDPWPNPKTITETQPGRKTPKASGNRKFRDRISSLFGKT